jgi:uncharacterized protein YbaA (DUF1428 family)
MSDLKKAAQQALAHVQEFKRRWMAVPPFGNKVNEATREAVTLAHAPVLQLEEDLRTALAQQEQADYPEEKLQAVAKYVADKSHVWYGIGARDVEEVLRQSVRCGLVGDPPRRETEQEPVAWMFDWDVYDPTNSGPDFSQTKPNDGKTWTPLYTHPPRREWQSLTDEEMHGLYRRAGLEAYYPRDGAVQYEYERRFDAYARAIEAALKERNT